MLIVLSDLDGTLLDHDTYSYDESLQGISMLREKQVPLVLVSSKTYDEMVLLHQELELEWPFVFENGGGIAYPREDGSYSITVFGPGSESLMKEVECLSKLLGSEIFPIASMTAEGLSRVTGLSLEKAELAQKRKSSMPFILEQNKSLTPEDLVKYNKLIGKKNITLTKGGRFYHLISAEFDKGAALDRIILYFRDRFTAVVTAAIGDSENDIPMLQKADYPFLVKKKNGTALETGIKNVIVTNAAGPAGFSEAVARLLKRD